MTANETVFSRMVRTVIERIEHGDAITAGQAFESTVTRMSLNRTAALTVIRSELFRQDPDSLSKKMAVLQAGISMVRGRAA